MPVALLTDHDVRERLDAPLAVAWMREALLAEYDGRLVAPPRTHVQLGDGRLVFTTGELRGEWFGYRSYDTFDVSPGEQVVVVHDAGDGHVRGIARGNELGPRRVGAIGAVAADLLAREDAATVAVIGTGTQAWHQLWALAAVRPLTDVRAYSRDAQRRERFVRRAADDLALAVSAAPDVRAAVEGADIVVLATNSATPVLDTAWVTPGAYITTLGPKQVGYSEFTPDLAAEADLVVTDSVAQVAAYDPPNVLAGTPQAERLVSLGAVLAGDAAGRTRDDERAVFFSVGLAGTEVFLLDKLLQSL